MKNTFKAFGIFVIMIFTVGILLGEVTTNPDDLLAQIRTKYEQFRQDVYQLTSNVQLDFHPVYGVVQMNDDPVHPGGWYDSYIPELVPGETVESYQTFPVLLNGKGLTQHKSTNGTLYHVWHQYQNEPAMFIAIKTQESELCRIWYIRRGCGNPIGVYVDGVFWGYLVSIY
jgi:hypothetical protein